MDYDYTSYMNVNGLRVCILNTDYDIAEIHHLDDEFYEDDDDYDEDDDWDDEEDEDDDDFDDFSYTRPEPKVYHDVDTSGVKIDSSKTFKTQEERDKYYGQAVENCLELNCFVFRDNGEELEFVCAPLKYDTSKPIDRYVWYDLEVKDPGFSIETPVLDRELFLEETEEDIEKSRRKRFRPMTIADLGG